MGAEPRGQAIQVSSQATGWPAALQLFQDFRGCEVRMEARGVDVTGDGGFFLVKVDKKPLGFRCFYEDLKYGVLDFIFFPFIRF